jgi:hypothetical protein
MWMGATTIRVVVNNTDKWVYVQNHERPNQHFSFEVMPPKNLLSPFNEYRVSIPVPWCTNQGEFNDEHYLEIGSWDGNNAPLTRKYVIWQHHRWGGWWGGDGDHIRFSRDGQWHNVNGDWVPGDNFVDGERLLRINDLDSNTGLFLVNITGA